MSGLSNIDGLTGIFNRRYFDQFLEKEWRRHQRMGYDFAVILGDIDHFKQFNDRYGHLEGDNCLRQVARAIQVVARRPGDLVARYGGEEFAVVLTETDAHGLGHVIKRVQTKIKELGIPTRTPPPPGHDQPRGAVSLARPENYPDPAPQGEKTNPGSCRTMIISQGSASGL